MKLLYFLFLFLPFAFTVPSFAITKNVTINFTIDNMSTLDVDGFDVYLAYQETMDGQVLLSNCVDPAVGSSSPFSITCDNVEIENFPVYLKVVSIVDGEEQSYDIYSISEGTGIIAVVQNFKLVTSSDSGSYTDGNTETVFYWKMESLPDVSVTSDVGDITITKHLNSGALSAGYEGNCLQQFDVWQSYKFTMAKLPAESGTISFYLKHNDSSSTADRTIRYLFRSENITVANSIYAWVSSDDIWFYIFDSNASLHRVFLQNDTWSSNTWYRYDFIWDSTVGYMAIKRDGVIIAESSETPWAAQNPVWGDQDFYIGYNYVTGWFDEFSISK